MSFVGGFYFGQGRGARGDAPPEQAASDELEKGRELAGADGKPTAGVGHVAVRGRITYKTSSGESKPDRGARILILPRQRSGTTKLPVTGFRPADSADDFRILAASLRELGGNAALIGEDGTYEISLPTPGTYQVIVLSRFQPAEGDAPLPPPLKALLETIFERTDALVGRAAYHHGQLRYQGGDAEIWDYAFERAS